MSEPLDNLVKIKKLKAEPYAKNEFDGMMESAGKSLKDSRKTDLDPENQFLLAYRASHLYALAALRAAGYRSQDRITVFQTLVHTVGLSAPKVRVLVQCHNDRNVSEYEGRTDVDLKLLAELIAITDELAGLIQAPTG